MKHKLIPFNYVDAAIFLSAFKDAIDSKDIESIKQVIASNTIAWRIAPQPATEQYRQMLQEYSQLINKSNEILFPEHT